MNNELKKNCKVHGELRPQDIYIKERHRKNKNGDSIYAPYPCCRICSTISNKKYLNSGKRKKYLQGWRKKNKEKYDSYIKKSLLKNREERLIRKKIYNKTDKAKKWKKKSVKKQIDLLTDTYIKELIRNNSDIDINSITPELIEIKRATLMLKRLVRKKNDK